VNGWECEYGRCDRHICAEEHKFKVKNSFKTDYMASCEPLPPYAERVGQQPDDPCQGYICVEGTCQSCLSDDECKHLKGQPTCTQFGDWPGKQCGRVVPGDAGADGNPPPPPEWKDTTVVSVSGCCPRIDLDAGRRAVTIDPPCKP
jgi:hypothetical protein